MKKINNAIITGGTGFIGSALHRKLQKSVGSEGKVISIGKNDIDLSNLNDTFEGFEKLKLDIECDHLFHLAALYKAGGWPIHHPATQFHVNMSINVNVLEAWVRFFPKAKLTSILSYCMYPPHDNPHPESELWSTEPEEYLYSYALTKKALLIGHKAYKQEYGLDCTSLILPTVYGPGDRFSEDSHVMSALIGKFVRASMNNLPFVEVWGDGQQEREFLYIDDAVDGIIEAARETNELVHNLGVGQTDTIFEIAQMIKKASNYKGEINFNKNKFTGVKKRVMNVNLIKENIGWEAKTSSWEGIQKTVNWYRQQLTKE